MQLSHTAACPSCSCSSIRGRRPPPRSLQVAAGLRRPAEGLETEVEVKGEPQAPSDAPASKGRVQQSLNDIGVLAGNLLMNAASWRVVRGQTYCLYCKGTGKEACSACQGAGIVQPEKVRMNQIRHAAGKVQVMLGLNDPKMFDSDWMKSNRCKRCRGTGAVLCKHCNGVGTRGPGQGSEAS